MKIFCNGQYSVMSHILSIYPRYRDYLGFLNTPKAALSFDTLARYGLPVAVDNSAFTEFNPRKYRSLLTRIEMDIEWITVPDIVADAGGTLQLFESWYPVLEKFPVAFVGQDGCEDLPVHWDAIACFFVGGSTEWKLSGAARDMIAEAQKHGKLTHMGRVNSDKRMRYAFGLGVDSVDGTGFSRFSKKHLLRGLSVLDGLHRQLTFEV